MRTHPSNRLIKVVSENYRSDCDGLSAEAMLEIIIQSELKIGNLVTAHPVIKFEDLLCRLNIPYDKEEISRVGIFLRKQVVFYFPNCMNAKYKIIYDYFDDCFIVDREDVPWYTAAISAAEKYISVLQDKHESECRQISAYDEENKKLRRKLKKAVQVIRMERKRSNG